MKKVCFFIILSIGFLNIGLAAEPENLSKAKKALVRYVDSGEYNRSLASSYQEAKQYLADRIAKHNETKEGKKLAVVLDIDETILSNYEHILHNHFGGSKQTIINEVSKAKDSVISPALDFVKYAQKQGVAIFLVTGREAFLRAATEINLKKAGFSNWQALYMKPNDYHASSIIPFKSTTRAAIETKGFVIVESIGDQWSDIEGGSVEKGIKLSNPFYFVP